MAPGNNLRNQRRKLTAGLTSLRRQKLTGGKYKSKLMNKQTEWARGGPTTYLSSYHRRSSIHHRGGTKLGTINLAQRFVLIWVWMIRKSMLTQCDQVNLCSLHFERLLLPQNYNVAVWKRQTGRWMLPGCTATTLISFEPLTSERDASQGVRVPQVVGSLQETTQHGWRCKCWQMFKNVFRRSVPQLIWKNCYMPMQPSKTNGLQAFSLKVSAN